MTGMCCINSCSKLCQCWLLCKSQAWSKLKSPLIEEETTPFALNIWGFYLLGFFNQLLVSFIFSLTIVNNCRVINNHLERTDLIIFFNVFQPLLVIFKLPDLNHPEKLFSFLFLWVTCRKILHISKPPTSHHENL